ncbi:uncharacterized protein MYCFIDRAFT_70778 [Pseudocercospora fijiensis CIRAD86]|uniref:FHA domain-containing protein n=1 Tax=Pseudocercospora fijiensis (strain CIRAD86) TaxID=383855 RepID=M3AZJ4_PSEFD|nr:uncharacterized protein MYCFIDRAFT_70778 [Pseudocercospora fijiensis CIRAD86]EME82593.1 hypothetical protein MYCFIDRAFT_70778 [Pseudocercospora fijiensis CIRAD86]
MPFGFHQDVEANNMASSSASAAVPKGRLSSHSITVSLTSNSSDRRTIELLPGTACIIGRASKSDFKNMRPTAHNALFDCPVVSRTHAELRASPWQPPGRQVTITDKSSLHGTTVNDTKLQPNVPFTLKTGDVIKLGDTVSRGKDTHDGVSLTFKRFADITAAPTSSRSPITARGFHLPVESDQSDFESDDDSIGSNPREHSSAKTTPEQYKMKPGSQSQPIDLDSTSVAPKSVIDLDADEEDELVFTRAIRPTMPSTIQESVDRDAPIIVPESITGQPARSPAYETESEAEADTMLRNTGLSQILNAPRSDSDDEPLYPDSGSEGDDYDDAHNDSDVDDENGESELDEQECPSVREPSPELGTTDEPSSPPYMPMSPVQSYALPSKPRYDPVRSSQPPAEEIGEKKAEVHGLAEKPTSTCTYGYPGSFGNSLMYPATDLPGNSRWDVTATSVSSFGYQIDHTEKDIAPTHFAPPTMFGASTSTPTFGLDSQMPTASYCSPPNPAYNTWQTAPISTTTANADRIAIDNLVEEPAKSTTAQPPQKTVVGLASVRTKHANEDIIYPDLIYPEEVLSTGTKRKADEMEVDESNESAARKSAKVDAATSTRGVSHRRKQKQPKRSTMKTVVVEAAKLVGYAGIGAAGFAAFLMSPYAQQAIDYLG